MNGRDIILKLMKDNKNIKILFVCCYLIISFYSVIRNERLQNTQLQGQSSFERVHR